MCPTSFGGAPLFWRKKATRRKDVDTGRGGAGLLGKDTGSIEECWGDEKDVGSLGDDLG